MGARDMASRRATGGSVRVDARLMTDSVSEICPLFGEAVEMAPGGAAINPIAGVDNDGGHPITRTSGNMASLAVDVNVVGRSLDAGVIGTGAPALNRNSGCRPLLIDVSGDPEDDDDAAGLSGNEDSLFRVRVVRSCA